MYLKINMILFLWFRYYVSKTAVIYYVFCLLLFSYSSFFIFREDLETVYYIFYGCSISSGQFYLVYRRDRILILYSFYGYASCFTYFKYFFFLVSGDS